MDQILDRLVDKIIEKKYIHKFSISLEARGYKYNFAYKMDEYEPFILASVTKLFTTASVLYFHENKVLSLEDPIEKYFEKDEILGLNTVKGIDHTSEIKIKHLLYQNAGLAGSKGEAIPMSKRLGKESESFKEVLYLTKASEALHRPGEGESYYTSINFLLLGKIIEVVTSMSLDKVFEKIIFEPLEMNSTYLTSPEKPSPKGYFKDKEIDITDRLISSSSAGAAVSNTNDLMTFIKAFFQGNFFDISLIKASNYYSLQKSYGPILYGLGHMKVLTDQGYFLGHNGISGAFAFYNPKKEIFMTGTFNQFANQSLTVDLAREIDMIFS